MARHSAALKLGMFSPTSVVKVFFQVGIYDFQVDISFNYGLNVQVWIFFTDNFSLNMRQ